METFLENLPLYRQQAKEATDLVVGFLITAKDSVLSMWENASDPTTRVFIAICALAAGTALLSVVISFFRARWREKLHMLLTLVVALAVLGFVLWYGLKGKA